MLDMLLISDRVENANRFALELGKFVLEFERVCDAMRFIIMFMLRSQGLSNQGMEQVIVGDKAAADIQKLLGAIYCELPNQDEEDKKRVKDLLKDLQKITEKRNVLLHSSWRLDGQQENEEAEFFAFTIRFRAKQNSGSAAEVHEYSPSLLAEISDELKKAQVLLARLQYCVTQSGFKVSSEFDKPM